MRNRARAQSCADPVVICTYVYDAAAFLVLPLRDRFAHRVVRLTSSVGTFTL